MTNKCLLPSKKIPSGKCLIHKDHTFDLCKFKFRICIVNNTERNNMEPDTRTAEELGKEIHSRHIFCNCGEQRFQRLPSYVQEEMTCNCNQPFDANLSQYILFNGNTFFGSYCNTCKKPQRFSVPDVALQCEGCDKYYVPGLEQFTDSNGEVQYGFPQWPPRWKLCSRCDVAPRVVTAKPKRSNFRFR